MNEILDLIPIPAERDFPAGRMDARRDALVASVVAELPRRRSVLGAVRAARGHITRSWLALLGVLALGLAMLTVNLSGYQSRVSTTSEAVFAAVGTAQIIAVIAAPCPPGSVELGVRKPSSARAVPS
jgi:hypothetical protein